MRNLKSLLLLCGFKREGDGRPVALGTRLLTIEVLGIMLNDGIALFIQDAG